MTARRNLKRVGALVLALAMCFALGATVLADTAVGTYSVTIYQDGTTTKSMADGCMGDATVTLSGTTYTVSIPLTSITMDYGGSTYSGTIFEIQIEQAIECDVTNNTLVFTVSSDDFAELTFDATMSVTVTAISGSGGYTHDNVAADIVLSK
ncbi:MAG: hypothetical protein LUD55_04200 [Oscillospiraceae bacterium]|nr:hypothetical protein [Oscillospiraceae bacterium]